MNTADALDHVGVAGRDLAALAAQYERLGFTLTPVARHRGPHFYGGPVERMGSGNRCAMLGEGYLELISVLEPGLFSSGMEELMDRYEGLHIIALTIEDEAANLARLQAAGFAIPGVAVLERPVDDADPSGLQARFARLPLPDAPEGRLQLIRHFTREAIWQPRFMAHENHAAALASVVLAVAEPAGSAARFSRLAGRPVVPDPLGGFCLEMPRGRVRLLPTEGIEKLFAGAVPPVLPWIAGFSVRTDDANAAVSGLLEGRGIEHGTVPGGLLVSPSAAGGGFLLFEPG
jgi:hypothetical protein